MAWSSVAHEPLWVGALGGVGFSLLRWRIVRNRQGCLGCLASSVWAWPIALLGGIVWLARAV